MEFEQNKNLPSVLATEVPEGSCEVLSPRAWTTQAVEEYCHFGTVREVRRDQCKLICALSMALKGSGRYRLCLDLRPLNKYLAELKFTMETLSRVRHLIRRDDWLLTIDLESAYNNFHVAEDHQFYCLLRVGGAVLHLCRALLRQQRGPLRVPADHGLSSPSTCAAWRCAWAATWMTCGSPSAAHGGGAALGAAAAEPLQAAGPPAQPEGKSVLEPDPAAAHPGDGRGHRGRTPSRSLRSAWRRWRRAREALLALEAGASQVRARELAKMVGQRSCPAMSRWGRWCGAGRAAATRRSAACTKVPVGRAAPRAAGGVG